MSSFINGGQRLLGSGLKEFQSVARTRSLKVGCKLGVMALGQILGQEK